MTKEELEKKAENSYWDSEASGSMSSKKCYVVGYIAGAKEMQEENEQLRQQIEKMKCCAVEIVVKSTRLVLEKNKCVVELIKLVMIGS